MDDNLNSAPRQSEGSSSDLALIQQTRESRSPLEMHPVWPLLGSVPLRMQVAIPLPRFCVRDLFALGVGSRIETDWAEAEDVPLSGGGAQISWCEFETIDDRIAVRLTRLC